MSAVDCLEVDLRDAKKVTEREIAVALVLELALSELPSFSMMGFYDDDAEFIDAVAERVSTPNNKAFTNKMTKVVRELVNCGVLVSRMGSTHKEYFGEPTKQKDYWLKPGKARLIQRGKTEHTMDSEGETDFLLRHAYPKATQ